MTFKRFPEHDFKNKENSYLEATKTGEFKSIPELVPQSSLNYTAPSDIPPRKGRTLAFILVTGFVGYLGYTFWNNFLRYDSYGVVEADIIGVYAPIPGVIDVLSVSEGSIVNKGDFIVRVSSVEDSRNLNKVTDEILIAQSDLKAKEEENNQKFLLKLDSIYQIETQIADLQTALKMLKTKMMSQKEEVDRFYRLKSKNAASFQEIAFSKSQLDLTLSEINGKEELLKILKNRLLALKTQNNDGVFLESLKKKIDYLNNEKMRLIQKIQDGLIYSQVSGMVSLVYKKPTEMTSIEPILNVVVNNTSRFVLFYDPSDKIPGVGSHVKVKVPSLGRLVDAVVVSISKNVTTPPDQIKTSYRANQKLIKVFLKPKNEDINLFVVGSVIKRPSTSDLIYNTFNQASNVIVPPSSAKTGHENEL